jgi:hypothetical protein
MADWKNVWKEAVAAATGKLEARGGEAQEYLKEVAEAHKQSLRSLMAAFADGQIDRDTFDSELADEKRLVRAELLAMQAIGKGAAQSAANAFFDVLESALAAGIGGLL